MALLQTRPYDLAEGLVDVTATSVKQQSPLDPDQEDLLLSKMGAKAWGRMIHFSQYYIPEWGECGQSTLSARGSDAFFKFLAHSSFAGAPPSLFLTDSGALEVAWEGSKGQRLTLEFGAEKIVLSDESTDSDVEFKLSEAAEVAGKVKVL